METKNRRLVAERLLVHVCGPVSQTINISGPARQVGQYEHTYRFSARAEVSLQDLAAAAADLPAVHAWLRDKGGQHEEPGKPKAVQRLVAAPEPDAWLDEAVAAVEGAMSALVQLFLEAPYLHRVEHSLHVELFALLRSSTVLGRSATTKDGFRTGLVHKEWPETFAQHKGGPRLVRGSFDLAVLHPAQVAQASSAEFREGRIAAPIVIELGLDYGLDHLLKDLHKLEVNKVLHPYVVHFARGPLHDRSVEERIVCLPDGQRGVYVHHHLGAQPARVKGLQDVEVSALHVPAPRGGT